MWLSHLTCANFDYEFWNPIPRNASEQIFNFANVLRVKNVEKMSQKLQVIKFKKLNKRLKLSNKEAKILRYKYK